MKVTSTDIKNSFGKYLRLCSTEPVYITKNGKTIAKLLNHTEEDDMIEESVNLRRVYQVDEQYYKDYEPDRVAEAMASYNLDLMEMTFEEFEAINEHSQNRYEYIDGEVYMLAAPSVYHQRAISKMHIAFDKYLEGKPCDVFESPFDVKLFRRGKERFKNIVQPDLLVICNWREEVNDKGRYTGTPTLVVEVVSPGNTTKELMTKMDLYCDSGIEEYWIVDDKRKYVVIYHFEDYKIIETRSYRIGEDCESMIYPGMIVNLAE